LNRTFAEARRDEKVGWPEEREPLPNEAERAKSLNNATRMSYQSKLQRLDGYYN
jgi:hypothetical protein